MHLKMWQLMYMPGSPGEGRRSVIEGVRIGSCRKVSDSLPVIYLKDLSIKFTHLKCWQANKFTGLL